MSRTLALPDRRFPVLLIKIYCAAIVFCSVLQLSFPGRSWRKIWRGYKGKMALPIPCKIVFLGWVMPSSRIGRCISIAVSQCYSLSVHWDLSPAESSGYKYIYLSMIFRVRLTSKWICWELGCTLHVYSVPFEDSEMLTPELEKLEFWGYNSRMSPAV